MITKLDIKRYGGWYHRARERLLRQFGSDADLFADILAATSPRVSVKKNWNTALTIYKHWKQTGNVALSLASMRPHHPNILRAFAGEPLSGMKVRSFAANLKGKYREVTIDVWMCRYFGIDQARLKRDKYIELRKRVRDCARKHGCLPCEYQAAVWTVERIKAGFKFKSFLSVVESDQQMKWYWAE